MQVQGTKLKENFHPALLNHGLAGLCLVLYWKIDW